jgi:hypothetical protein
MVYERYLFVEINGRWWYWFEHKKLMQKIQETVYTDFDSQFIH